LVLEAIFIYRPADNSIKKKTQELISQSKYLDVVTQINTNAIIAIDDNFNILTFNKSAEKIFGYSAKEMLYTKLIDDRIIPLKYLKQHNIGLKNFATTGKLKHNSAVFELEAQKAELDGARYDRNKSWSSHLPRLDLRGSYGRNQYAQDFDIKWDDPQKSASAGLSLSLNLFDGFKRSTQTQNAKIGLKNRELQLEQARLNLKKDLSNAFSAYQNKRAILKMEQKSAASAELNFKRTKELFDLGRLTNTQFREAQLNLVRVKYNLSQAKFQAKIAEINLLRLSGVLLKAEGN
jgi:PAS domain S-box-containing protein